MAGGTLEDDLVETGVTPDGVEDGGVLEVTTTVPVGDGEPEMVVLVVVGTIVGGVVGVDGGTSFVGVAVFFG